MTKITAVILAAGMGVRMGARGKLMPKGMVQIGGSPIISQSVATMRAHGVARIVVVSGHLGEQFEDLFAGTDVELVHNPEFARTGSLLSLAVGLEAVDGPCIIAESDLIYAPQALSFLDCSTNRFLVSGPTGAGDEQYVWAQTQADGTHMLQDISKNRGKRPEQPLGEMVGLTALTEASVPLMRKVAAQVLAGKPDEHYEPAVVALSQQTAMECPLMPDLAWAEIDNETMLARARRLVYPRVAAARDIKAAARSAEHTQPV